MAVLQGVGSRVCITIVRAVALPVRPACWRMVGVAAGKVLRATQYTPCWSVADQLAARYWPVGGQVGHLRIDPQNDVFRKSFKRRSAPQHFLVGTLVSHVVALGGWSYIFDRACRIRSRRTKVI